jgi:hypothetical protein
LGISKNYLLAFAGAFAGVFAGALAGAFAGALFAGGAAGSVTVWAGLTFASTGAAVFAFTSAGPAVFALASEVLLFDSTGASGLADKTDTLPVRAGIASSRAESINVVAAPIVTLESTVAVPLGLSAELETLLVKRAPASVLPGCSNTAATSTRHDRKNIPYKI